MQRLLNDTLDVERISYGALELSYSPVDMRDVVRRAVLLMARSAEHRQVQLTLQLDPAVPDVLIADADRLRQVVTNLISNALKFVPQDGSGKVMVRLLRVTGPSAARSPASGVAATGLTPGSVAGPWTSRGSTYGVAGGCAALGRLAGPLTPRGGADGAASGRLSPGRVTRARRVCIRIDVSDNGCGISDADQARLFQQFAQVAPAPLQHGQGSGLGLYICRRIVDAHGGRISVRSRAGEGSVFSVDLPLAECVAAIASTDTAAQFDRALRVPEDARVSSPLPRAAPQEPPRAVDDPPRAYEERLGAHEEQPSPPRRRVPLSSLWTTRRAVAHCLLGHWPAVGQERTWFAPRRVQKLCGWWRPIRSGSQRFASTCGCLAWTDPLQPPSCARLDTAASWLA
jgi:two-component sensor histidine kinase